MSDSWTKAAGISGIFLAIPAAILAGLEINDRFPSNPKPEPPANAEPSPTPKQPKSEGDKGSKPQRPTGSIKRKPFDEPGIADDISRWWNSLGKPWPKEAVRDPSTRD